MRIPWFTRKHKGKQRGRQSFSVRNFSAAQTDRLLSGWRFDGGFSAEEIRGQLATIRSRSRELAKNNSAQKRFIQLCAINIVGEGFTLKSTPHDGIPGRPDYRLDTMAAKFIEYHWWRFCRMRDPKTGRTYYDATGTKTDAEMDALNVKTWARDGEYFQIPVVSDNPYGISFRVVRPDACDETYFREGSAVENPVYCGREIDKNTGAPVAYYFHTLDPQSGYKGFRGPLVRIPADRVIHGFTQEDEDQPRGVPMSHACLIKMKMLEEYDKAEITAARDEACTVRNYYADGPEANAEDFVDLNDADNAEVANALVAPKEPGQSEIIPRGYRSELQTPQHPNRELTAFKASMNRDISSGQGIEYANAFNDWAGVSFSSVRQGTISERDGWTMLQMQYIAQNKSRSYLMWLKSFLSLAISGNFPAEKFDKFSEHEIRGRRWMWVDPMKDMRAAEVAVDRKWKTNAQVAADLGGDYYDNVEESMREQSAAAGDSKESVPILNGAQVTSALEVVQNYAAGLIGSEAAIALLTGAGIPIESAQNMINKQKVSKQTEQKATAQ